MKKIVLISCVKTKLNQKAKAEFLYTSDLFKKNLKYAKSIKPDLIFILSAKYGLVELGNEIEPYEKTLNTMRKNDRVEWSKKVIAELTRKTDIGKDEFIFLAGIKYREFLLDKMNNYKIPMKGKGFGMQLKWLKENTYEN